MVFFGFEAVACYISQDSLDNGECWNTSFAAMFLSAYLAVFTMLTIVNKSVPRSVQRETVPERLNDGYAEGFEVVATVRRR